MVDPANVVEAVDVTLSPVVCKVNPLWLGPPSLELESAPLSISFTSALAAEVRPTVSLAAGNSSLIVEKL